jgi:hypothetical protein
MILDRSRRFTTTALVSLWMQYLLSAHIPKSLCCTHRMVSRDTLNCEAIFVAVRIQSRLTRSRIVLISAGVLITCFRFYATWIPMSRFPINTSAGYIKALKLTPYYFPFLRISVPMMFLWHATILHHWVLLAEYYWAFWRLVLHE